MRLGKTNIGSIKLLDELPLSIIIHGKPYIINKMDPESFILYSAICPHMHGEVTATNDKIWYCPQHNWTFDPKTGNSINAPQACLISYPIEIQNDQIFADIPLDTTIKFTSSNSKEKPKITLISHACLLFEWKDFKLLTDPWIEGPAFLGSWTLYPPSTIKVSDLPKVDAIWISHEHSDHFNPHTLSLIDKDIPIYISNLDNRRLVSRLTEYGFNDIYGTHSFESITLRKDIQITSFESSSVWNDNVLLMRFGNFSVLNFNDAGFNWKIKNFVDKVDLICSAFSWGASGYPLTWTHLNDKQKVSIMEKANKGLLVGIKFLIEQFHAKFYIPFASLSKLYYPDHLQYQKTRKSNSHETVKNYLKNIPVKVIDLLPGESWDVETDQISRIPHRRKFFNNKFLYTYLKNQFDKEKREKFIPSQFTLSDSMIIDYFEKFSGSELLKQVGTTTIAFSAISPSKTLHFLINFKEGKVSCQQTDTTRKAEVTMTCPAGLVQEIILNDLSWDEAHIGYWCIFSRDPDVYNIALWKLFHAPWKARNNKIFSNQIKPTSKSVSITILKNLAVADILEKFGNKPLDILQKYGMYCSGCNASVGETLIEGCKSHGLSKKQTEILLEEICYVVEKVTNESRAS